VVLCLLTISSSFLSLSRFFFSFHPPSYSVIYTLSLHDALPIYCNLTLGFFRGIHFPGCNHEILASLRQICIEVAVLSMIVDLSENAWEGVINIKHLPARSLGKQGTVNPLPSSADTVDVYDACRGA